MQNKIKTLLCGLAVTAFSASPLFAQVKVSAEPSVGNLAQRAAATYQLEARYPEWSRVIEAGMNDPVMAERIPTRQSLPGPNGASQRLEVWADSVVVLPGGSVTLHARLIDSANSKPIDNALNRPAEIRQVSAEVIGEQNGLLGTLSYVDNGIGADLVAGDGIFTAQYQPSASLTPEPGFAEAIMINTLAVMQNGEFWEATGGFVHSNPAARSTGRVSEDIRDGSMLLGIELEVLAAGRVHIAGTLADTNGEPFVTAQQAAFLEPGIHTMDLSFYGLAFHDRAVNGEVKLDSLVVTSANGIPNAIAPAITNVRAIAPVNRATLDALTNEPYNDLSKLDSARRLLESTGRPQATNSPPTKG